MFAPSQLAVLAAQAATPPRIESRPSRHRRRRGALADDIAIRIAQCRDAAVLRRLEAMEGRALAPGQRLLAELGGVPVAAIAVADDTVVADPFERSAAVIDLLRVRARQLREGAGRPAPRLALLERLAR